MSKISSLIGPRVNHEEGSDICEKQRHCKSKSLKRSDAKDRMAGCGSIIGCENAYVLTVQQSVSRPIGQNFIIARLHAVDCEWDPTCDKVLIPCRDFLL